MSLLGWKIILVDFPKSTKYNFSIGNDQMQEKLVSLHFDRTYHANNSKVNLRKITRFMILCIIIWVGVKKDGLWVEPKNSYIWSFMYLT